MAKLWKGHWYPIPWVTNDDEEDFFASIGNYRLRVEQMDQGRWWWRVYIGEQEIHTALNEHASSKCRAIALAEGVYFGHVSTVRNPDFIVQIIGSKINQSEQNQ